MYLTPNRFKRYPFAVWFIGPLWGILDTKADPPCIVQEFDTEDEAWVHALALNQSYWSEQEAKSAAYWAIQKASEESLRPVTLGVFVSLWTRLKAVLRP